MAQLDIRHVAGAIEHSRVVRTVVRYDHESDEVTSESCEHLVHNVSPEPLRLVMLPALRVGHQALVQVRSEDRDLPLLPQSVLHAILTRAVERLGLAAADKEAALASLRNIFASPPSQAPPEGYATARKGVRPKTASDALRHALRSARRDPDAVGVLHMVAQRAQEGKFIPLVVVPEGARADAGGFQAIVTSKLHRERQGAGAFVAGVVGGEFRVRQRLAVNGPNVSHIHVTPARGTHLVRAEHPPHWRRDWAPAGTPPRAKPTAAAGPVGSSKLTRRGWRVDLSRRDKAVIWANAKRRDATGKRLADDPGHADWFATSVFAIPRAVHFSMALAWCILALGWAFILAYASAPTDLMQGMLALLAIQAGILFPLLASYGRDPLPFAYVGLRTAAIVLACAALLLTALAGQGEWIAMAACAVAFFVEVVLLGRRQMQMNKLP